MLPVSPEVMYNELETAAKILKKWQDRMDQVPGENIPSTDPAALQRFLVQLVGELRVVSGKCDTLSEALMAGVQ